MENTPFIDIFAGGAEFTQKPCLDSDSRQTMIYLECQKVILMTDIQISQLFKTVCFCRYVGENDH